MLRNTVLLLQLHLIARWTLIFFQLGPRQRALVGEKLRTASRPPSNYPGFLSYRNNLASALKWSPSRQPPAKTDRNLPQEHSYSQAWAESRLHWPALPFSKQGWTENKTGYGPTSSRERPVLLLPQVGLPNTNLCFPPPPDASAGAFSFFLPTGTCYASARLRHWYNKPLFLGCCAVPGAAGFGPPSFPSPLSVNWLSRHCRRRRPLTSRGRAKRRWDSPATEAQRESARERRVSAGKTRKGVWVRWCARRVRAQSALKKRSLSSSFWGRTQNSARGVAGREPGGCGLQNGKRKLGWGLRKARLF